MTYNYNGERTNDSNGAAFNFQKGDEWTRLGADVGQLCRQITDLVREAIAGIDFEGIGREVRQAMREASEEIRQAGQQMAAERRGEGRAPAAADVSPAEAAAPAEDSAKGPDERLTILELVSQGKITAAEAARLLDALDG